MVQEVARQPLCSIGHKGTTFQGRMQRLKAQRFHSVLQGQAGHGPYEWGAHEEHTVGAEPLSPVLA